MPPESLASIVVASNRGPVSFSLVDGTPTPTRGAGGLVTGLAPIVEQSAATWVAAAMTAGDRSVASAGTTTTDGGSVRFVDIDEATYGAAYDVIANGTLWYAHHGLWDNARRPRFDRHWWSAWDAYVAYNEAFASSIDQVSAADATVLVQDYHLSLLGSMLADRRPDLRTIHFHHTPFASPDSLGVLPDVARSMLLRGLSAHRACGFHTGRWATRFLECVDAAHLDEPATFVSPLASDPTEIRRVATSAETDAALARLAETAGDRFVIGRVDRIELSKNILRGFLAYELLLEERTDLRDRVVFAASVYPSRQNLPDYVAYRQEVEGVVDRINERFGNGDRLVVELDTSDDLPTSMALLRRYDALLVNPIVDGLNLVASEGPLVNERDGAVLLSRGAGIFDSIGDLVTEVHPYDIAGTADALARCIDRSPEERAAQASARRDRLEARGPARWWTDNLDAAQVP